MSSFCPPFLVKMSSFSSFLDVSSHLTPCTLYASSTLHWLQKLTRMHSSGLVDHMQQSPSQGGSCPRGWGGLVLGGSGARGVWCQGGLVPGGFGVSQHALRQTPPPPVDRQMLVKISPWPNFVAAGNVSL